MKRKTITAKSLSSLRKRLATEKKCAETWLFAKAWSRLSAHAKRKKRKITPGLVREYFLGRHNSVVLRVAKKKRDVIPKRCFIVPGRLARLNGKTAVADTPFGPRKIIIGLVPNLRKGDTVAIHYDYACERIPKAEFTRLWEELS